MVVLRSPIHANEPSEYNGMLYRTSNRVLNNGIKVIILICMDGTSQYHHHQFFTPFSTSIPFFSVMLISFILLAFPSSSFLWIWLLEFAIACCIYLICPLWRKAWLFDTLGCIFPPFFSLFPPLDVESLSLAFYLFSNCIDYRDLAGWQNLPTRTLDSWTW